MENNKTTDQNPENNQPEENTKAAKKSAVKKEKKEIADKPGTHEDNTPEAGSENISSGKATADEKSKKPTEVAPEEGEEVEKKDLSEKSKVTESTAEKEDTKSAAEKEDAESTAEKEDAKSAAEKEDAESVGEKEDTKNTAEKEDAKSVAEKKDTKSTAEKEDAKSVAEKEDTKNTAEKEDAKSVAEKEDAESVGEKEDTKNTAEKEDAKSVAEKEDTKSTAEKEDAESVAEKEEAGSVAEKEDTKSTAEKEEAKSLAEKEEAKSVAEKEDNKKAPEQKAEEKTQSSDEDDEDDEDGKEADEDEDEAFEEFSEEELISRLEELVQTEDISNIKTKVALIKVAFMRIVKEKKQEALDKFLDEGGKKEDFKYEESDLEKRYSKAFEVYKKNKARYNELLEEKKTENLEKKKQILEQLKELINSEESLKKTYDQFRALQAEWKDGGMVPTGEVSNLWQNYHFLVEKFFDKVKINKELRDLDMKKNLELKIELCEKAEELLLETSIIKSFKELQKYHEEWKEIGPVPQDKNDEIWERFKAATDKINDRRREHYGKLQEEQEQNLLAKTNLCEQVEELLTVTPENFKQWQQQTNKMNELFSVWRSIGRAPKKSNTEIWERFKGSMNTFYNNKKEFMKTIKNEQLNNYNLKVDLCAQAENIKDSNDWKKTTQELIRLQKEWKKIGPVPRKHSDKIWKRFRAACDDFFNRKSDHFAGIHENEKENLKKKKDLIEQIKTKKFEDDKKKNLNILKEFQREWLEIGFVPMKEKEKVQKEFRLAVDARLEDLKISATELNSASYATRMEAVKGSPDADRVYRKEIGFLNNKINKLREDINLWENNLGFFANSKKADILKQEFEQKIEKAKQELAGMEAKVKYLRKMSSNS